MIEAASLDERIAKCEKILKGNANSQVFAPLADALRLRGDLDQAFRICRQGLRVHPEYGAGHLVMARINLDRKMYDWAERELDEAVRLEGDSRASEQLRAEILIAKGQLEQATELLGRLKGIGGNPLYIQDLSDRIRRAAQKQERAEKTDNSQSPRLEGRPGESDQASAKSQVYTISAVLDSLSSFERVVYVICSDEDGAVVGEWGACESSADEVAALATEIQLAAEDDVAVRHFGKPLQVTAYLENSILIVFRLHKYLLALVCDLAANLGSLRLKLEDIALNFEES